jgi:hypothetical protein
MKVGRNGTMKVGLITRWNPKLEIGVIFVGPGEQYFLHENEVEAGWLDLGLGAEVLFRVSDRKPEPGKMPNAISVKVLPGVSR